MARSVLPKADIQEEEAAAVPVPKPRRAYLPAKERKRRIILAAQEVFGRSNLQGARTRDIAKAAKINQATLFEHFESKEALFQEAVVQPLVEAMRGMHERAEAYEAAGSIDEMLVLAEGSAQRHLEAMIGIFPLLTAALFSDPALGQKLYREQIVPLLKQRAETMRGLTKETIDPDLVALANFGVFFAIALDGNFTGKTPDTHALASQITKLAATGFAKPHEADPDA